MITTFEQLEGVIAQRKGKKILAVAGSHDEHVLRTVVRACEKGLAEAVLIGREKETKQILSQLGCKAEFEFIDLAQDEEIANRACKMVWEKNADIPMKGMIKTASFMRAVLDKTYGFVGEKALLSQATVFEFAGRLRFAADCAVNIEPSYEEKVKIVKNTVALARRFGIETPKVAVLAPVEVVNPKMQATIDAAMLTVACGRGQLGSCIVDGPLALDNALSKEAARSKGIQSAVAGDADIFLLPDINASNIFTKSLTYAAGLKTAGTLNGTTVPVIMCSRTDSEEDKYHSILASIL